MTIRNPWAVNTDPGAPCGLPNLDLPASGVKDGGVRPRETPWWRLPGFSARQPMRPDADFIRPRPLDMHGIVASVVEYKVFYEYVHLFLRLACAAGDHSFRQSVQSHATGPARNPTHCDRP